MIHCSLTLGVQIQIVSFGWLRCHEHEGVPSHGEPYAQESVPMAVKYEWN